MKKISAVAKFGINEILYIIYRICRAFIIWFEEDDKK